MPEQACQPGAPAGVEQAELPPVAVLLTALSDAAEYLARHWTEATEDTAFAQDVRWCAVAVAEEVAALLRGDHARAVDLADHVADAVAIAVRHAVEGEEPITDHAFAPSDLAAPGECYECGQPQGDHAVQEGDR